MKKISLKSSRRLLAPATVLATLLAPLAMAYPPHTCLYPVDCSTAHYGDVCGERSYIQVVHVGTGTYQYCSKRNPNFQACPVATNECNEKENWSMGISEVRCINQDTGAYTVLYTCNDATVARTATQQLCLDCSAN